MSTDAKKIADSDKIEATVEIGGLSSFPYPKLDEMKAVELFCSFGLKGTEINGELVVSSNSVYYQYLTLSGYRMTAVAMRNNRESHKGHELYTMMRKILIDLLSRHKCVSIWIGDVKGVLTKVKFKFDGQTYDEMRTALNKLIAGDKWTRTMIFILEGHQPIELWAQHHNKRLIERHNNVQLVTAGARMCLTWDDVRNGRKQLT